MSSPYGQQGGPGQQGSGPYGGQGAQWAQQAPGQAGPAFGGPPPGGPGQGFGPGYAPGGPAAGGPGFSGQSVGGPGQDGYGGQAQGGQVQGGPGQGGPGHGSPLRGSSQSTGQQASAKMPVDLGKLLPLILGGLGVLAFILGFLPGQKYSSGGSSDSISVYSTVVAYLPILLLLTGLLAVAHLLPGGKKYPVPTALLAVVGLLAAITGLTSAADGFSNGIGLILLLIVAILMAGAAVYAWLTESGGLKSPKAGPTGGSNSGRLGAPGNSAFAPSGPAPSAAPAAPAGYGGYPAGGYSGGAPGQPSESQSYGGYGAGQSSGSQPHAGPGESYQPYPAPGEQAGFRSGTGAHPAVDGPSQSSSYGTSAGEAAPLADRQGRDDLPPDVTQQVRF